MEKYEKKKHKRGAEISTRLIITAVFILLQLALFVSSVYFLAEKTLWLYASFEIVSIIIVIHILGKKGNPSYKITWIICILIFPLFGGLIYVFWGGGRIFPHIKRRMKKFSDGAKPYLVQDSKVKSRLMYDDIIHFKQSEYLARTSGYPVYENTDCEYLSPGEKAFPVLINELKKAKKYIFIEMFILAEDSIWQEIFDVLKEKVKNGIEVRVMFDDFGSIARQYRGFAERLKQSGIKVAVFNKIKPSVNIFMNNRNHRKIIVIDGKVAFTGGMNIADEYANRIERFGYWMDCMIKLEGKAVTSFVTMFLSMWGFSTEKKQYYSKYIMDYSLPSGGFVQPYCDGPINNKNPAEGIYMQILNTAQKYVYIATPYLIVDNTMIRSLCLAAASGTDVRIITPFVPDKWYVHPVTQNSYGELLAAGVKIYEYTPGFIHSKLFVSDDKVATVGTVNMDYRSFFFHFECGVWMNGTTAVDDIKSHFIQLQNKSKQINLEEWKKRPIKQKLKQAILNMFAPFM